MILWKYANGVPMVSGKGTFGTYWLKRLGVTDVVVKEASGFTQVNMEPGIHLGSRYPFP